MNIFVFGSNLAGVHGAGAARYALQHHGAVMGQGVGHAGTSYALPTKDERIQTLPLEIIETYLADLVEVATSHPDDTYFLTPVGCGLAGYKKEDILGLLRSIDQVTPIPKNLVFTKEWFGFE